MIYVPWLLALITAGCFALLARKAGRNLVPWALTGAVIALVAGTIVLGLGKATDNPFSDQQLKLFQMRWVVEAVLTIAVVSWFFTLSLHQHHLALWRKLTGKPLPPAPPAPAAEAKPKAEAPKQPSKA
jgi:hypothetical protein